MDELKARSSRRPRGIPLRLPDLPGERWLPVASYEDLYAVSDFGRIRSFHWGEPMGHILRPGLSGRGCLVVGLCRDRRRRTVAV